jgi:hypothetical protein
MVVNRVPRLLAVVAATLVLSACISPKSYVDPALGNVVVTSLPKPSKPAPVQLLVEFQTKGSPNARATETVRPKVLEQVNQSGLFSQASYQPVTPSRTLSMVFNNMPLTDNVGAKGFGVGLTFGLVGTMVTDGYVCNITLSEPGKQPITKEVKHALHTTVGNADGVKGVSPMAPVDAFNLVLQQLVAAGLKQIAEDAAFTK